MISFTKAIEEAKSLAGDEDYYRSPMVRAAVAAIHGLAIGDGTTNEHGVFPESECIKFGDDKDRQCNADICLVKTPKGHWLMDTSYMIHYQGAGASPSIWNRVGYETREEALSAGAAKLIETCNRLLRDRDGGYHAKAMRLKQMIEQMQASQQQLSLF